MQHASLRLLAATVALLAGLALVACTDPGQENETDSSSASTSESTAALETDDLIPGGDTAGDGTGTPIGGEAESGDRDPWESFSIPEIDLPVDWFH